MRETGVIKCQIPRCSKTIYKSDPPVYAETGLCSNHCVCLRCSKPVELDDFGNPSCSECDSSWGLLSFIKLAKETFSSGKSIRAMLEDSDIDWMNGQIVFEEGRGPDGVRFLDFKVDYTRYKRGVAIPTAQILDVASEDPAFEKSHDPPCTNWIAQDSNFIYVPELTDDKEAVVKRYPRDVRRLVKGFISMPVIEVHVDTTDPEYKKQKENLMDGSVYGKEFKIS